MTLPDTAAILDAFRRQPRAAQWGIGAIVLIVLFMTWDTLSSRSRQWNEQSDALLADVARAAGSADRLESLKRKRDTVQALGAVQSPRKVDVASDALYDLISEVLKRHSVAHDSFNYRGPTKMPRGMLQQVLRPGEQLERISGDLRFDSDPEEAVAIIAELESNPQVEAVSSVRLTRSPTPGKLSVDLSIDAWIVSKATRTARAGGGA